MDSLPLDSITNQINQNEELSQPLSSILNKDIAQKGISQLKTKLSLKVKIPEDKIKLNQNWENNNKNNSNEKSIEVN